MDDLGFDQWLDWESVIFFSPPPAWQLDRPHWFLRSRQNKRQASWPGNGAEGGKEDRQVVNASLANAKEISQVCPIGPKVCTSYGFQFVVPGEPFSNLRKPNSCHSTFCNWQINKSWCSVSLSPAQEACVCATASRCKASRNWRTLWFWFTKVRDQLHARVSVITKDGWWGWWGINLEIINVDCCIVIN